MTYLPTTSLVSASLFRLALLGDVHGKWNRVQPILDHEFPDGRGEALCVGDLVDYPSLPQDHQIHFVPGNHENFKALESARQGTGGLPSQYHPLYAGDLRRVGGLFVAGLPGVFSPYFFDRPKEAPATYFTRDHLEALNAIPNPIDVLLMHEAPKDVGFSKNGEDYGQPLLTELVRRLKPRLVLFGHHHTAFEGRLEETRIVGLDYPKRSYGILEHDAGTGTIHVSRREAEVVQINRGSSTYRYDWPHERFSRDPDHAMRRGAAILFGGGIPLEREERMRERLEGLRPKVLEKVRQQILEPLKLARNPNAERTAETRSGLAVNTALPFVARYAARLESEANLPSAEKKRIMDEIHAEMTGGVIPQAVPDILLAFQAFLRALHLLGN